MSFEVFEQQYEVLLEDRKYVQGGIEVDFEISYDDNSKTNSSKIILWNLSTETLSLLTAGKPIVLSGGWKASHGIIFTGEIVNVQTERRKGTGDTSTTIYVSQNRSMWFKTTVNKEWKAPISVKDIINDLIYNSNFELGFIDSEVDFVYKRNWSFNGKLKDALAELAEDAGARAYNEDGKIYFVLPGKSVVQKIDVESNHILRSPTRTAKNSWKFTSILRYEARPGTLVNLHSRYLEGEFITLNVKHIRTGDRKFVTEWEVSTEDGASSEEESTEAQFNS